MSILLKEGRKEDLKKKYSDKFDEETLDWILNISDLVDFNHKYTDFVLRIINPKTDDVAWWAETIIEELKMFDKYQNQFEKKDINQYKSYYELENAVDSFRQKEKEKELEKQVDKIYEDGKFMVVKPKSEEASCKYGSNTKWCVTSKGSSHFSRYTSGRQALYFIINKVNSTNKNYSKVAVHFDEAGDIRYWDTLDIPLDRRESDILEYAFPEMIESIKDDHKKTSASNIDIYLKQSFNSNGQTTSIKRDWLEHGTTLAVSVEGFSTIDDLGPGHAEGTAKILLNSKEIDGYLIYITFKPIDEKAFSGSIGFAGADGYDIDLGLEGWGFDTRYIINGEPSKLAEGVRNHIASRTLDEIQNKDVLIKLAGGSGKVWRPNRASYGYTFKGSDKGLIKKLVNWLDKGNIGTKLEFLVDIGKLEMKNVDNNKPVYRIKGSAHDWRTSGDLRGHFSSFFASAKLAGILNYRKVGNQYLMIKGPNYEAFKKGELKAL
jgi:hypothetical protein